MNTDSGWSSCPEGAIELVVKELDRQHRREVLRRALGAGVMACLITIVGAFWLNQGDAISPGKLTCKEVKQLMPGYRAQNLDAELARRVESHLKSCEACQAKFATPFREPTDQLLASR